MLTDLESFRDVLFLEGRDSIDQLRSTTSEMAGFIKGLEECGFEMVPTLWAWGLNNDGQLGDGTNLLFNEQ